MFRHVGSQVRNPPVHVSSSHFHEVVHVGDHSIGRFSATQLTGCRWLSFLALLHGESWGPSGQVHTMSAQRRVSMSAPVQSRNPRDHDYRSSTSKLQWMLRCEVRWSREPKNMSRCRPSAKWLNLCRICKMGGTTLENVLAEDGP